MTLVRSRDILDAGVRAAMDRQSISTWSPSGPGHGPQGPLAPAVFPVVTILVPSRDFWHVCITSVITHIFSLQSILRCHLNLFYDLHHVEVSRVALTWPHAPALTPGLLCPVLRPPVCPPVSQQLWEVRGFSAIAASAHLRLSSAPHVTFTQWTPV